MNRFFTRGSILTTIGISAILTACANGGYYTGPEPDGGASSRPYTYPSSRIRDTSGSSYRYWRPDNGSIPVIYPSGGAYLRFSDPRFRYRSRYYSRTYLDRTRDDDTPYDRPYYYRAYDYYRPYRYRYYRAYDDNRRHRYHRAYRHNYRHRSYDRRDNRYRHRTRGSRHPHAEHRAVERQRNDGRRTQRRGTERGHSIHRGNRAYRIRGN